MKTGLLLLVLAALLGPASVRAQGTIHFTTTLAGFESRNSTVPVRGSGTVSLSRPNPRSDGTVSYDFTVPINRNVPVEANLHGPAIAGENPIVSLAPFLPVTGGIRYVGSTTLQRKWLEDFEAGRWYINLHNPNYENAIISGFIVPVVPEPGAAALLLLGGAGLGYARFSSRKRW